MESPDNRPHLKEVLYSYQSQAMNTLQGPGINHLLEHGRKLGSEKDKGYNFKKAFICDLFHKAKEDSCHKRDVEIVRVPMQHKCSAETTPWQTTITPCLERGRSPDKPHNKDETKIILIKKDPPNKRTSAENGNQTRHRKWVEQLPEEGFMAPPFPPKPLPVLASADPGVLPSHGRSETYLDGESIACFYIGGEPRLCLPQILNTILRNFSLTHINAYCDELQIFCSRCTAPQLDYLKDTGVLPSSATSCGLITKTDAQRLTHALFCSILQRPAPGNLNPDKHPNISVFHSCFGKCKALIWTDLYTAVSDPCVECLECSNMFTPMQFVCHAHKNVENRTCHWGFDADNWRSYLMLTKEQNQPLNKAEVELQAFKNKFDTANHKRKQSLDLKDEAAKKVRSEDLYPNYDPAFLTSYMTWGPFNNALAPPWAVVPLITKDGKQLPLPPRVFVKDSMPSLIPEYLSQGPPVLLDPARVVPLSESENFSRSFQPNVALAPLKTRHKCTARDGMVKHNDDEINNKSTLKEKIFVSTGISVTPIDRDSNYIKVETELPETVDADPKESSEDQLVVLKLDPDCLQKGISIADCNLPSDLELSTTDSDNESINSVTSKSEVVEETEALLRGWTTDRAAAKKVLEIVDSLAKSALEKDKKLDEASKENARLLYSLQMYKKDQEIRQRATSVIEEQMKEKFSSSGDSCFRVKEEP